MHNFFEQIVFLHRCNQQSDSVNFVIVYVNTVNDNTSYVLYRYRFLSYQEMDTTGNFNLICVFS